MVKIDITRLTRPRNTQCRCSKPFLGSISHANTHISQASGFSTSRWLAKKGGKEGKGAKSNKEDKQDVGKVDAAKSSKDPRAGDEDPFDFDALEADLASCIEKLRESLSKLRTGGRFNHEMIENLRVQPDKSEKQTIKLNDLAQVIPKGRTVQVLVGEQDVCDAVIPLVTKRS